LTEYGEDITLPIYGFGDRAICKSKIRQGETKIIFAKTARDGTILTLASSPLSISHGNLERIEALSKGKNISLQDQNSTFDLNQKIPAYQKYPPEAKINKNFSSQVGSGAT
jgi:hypothetical protein